MVATSAITAGTYGSIAAAIPQVDLTAMSKAASQAIWRGARFAAHEIVTSFFAPWRANPIAIAVVNPWIYIRSAVQRGVCTLDQLTTAWDTCQDHFVGPLSALRQSLKLAGLEGNPQQLISIPLSRSIDPLGVPLFHLREYLLNALRTKDLATLAKRRPSMEPWAAPFDHWATFRLLRSGSCPESFKAALRSLLAGGSVTGSQ